MKQIYICLLIGMIVTSCKKETVNVSNIQQSSSDSAIQFLKSELPGSDFSKLDVESIQILRLKNKDIGVRIFEKGMSPDYFIILKKEANSFTGHWVSISGIKTAEHNGTIVLETLDKRFRTKFVVESNKVIQVIATDNKGSRLISIPSKRVSNTARDSNTESYVLPEVVIVGYRQSITIEFYSLYWLFNQNWMYDSYYLPYDDGGGSGGYGGGGSTDNVEAAPKTYSPDKPVSDIKSEIKCFSNNTSSTYSISVNINQPVPRSRGIFEPSATFPVGHTYLTLQQNNSDGSSIIRNIGFYPKNMVKPGSATDLSTFGEDSDTPFDVSLRISVTGDDFLTVVSNLVSQQSSTYDLNNFNCVNSAINALGSINIHLPSTNSSSILFSGNNPADLGEDIKNLNLDNFSANNGGRKMVRTTSNNNSQKPPGKAGGC